MSEENPELKEVTPTPAEELNFGMPPAGEPSPVSEPEAPKEPAIPAYRNDLDESGNPAGGYVRVPGVSIDWQKGPLKENGANGAQIEDVLEAGLQRLRWFQRGKFACDENADAVRHITNALAALRARTARRVRDGVEGTHGLGVAEMALQRDLAAGKPAE